MVAAIADPARLARPRAGARAGGARRAAASCSTAARASAWPTGSCGSNCRPTGAATRRSKAPRAAAFRPTSPSGPTMRCRSSDRSSIIQDGQRWRALEPRLRADAASPAPITGSRRASRAASRLRNTVDGVKRDGARSASPKTTAPNSGGSGCTNNSGRRQAAAADELPRNRDARARDLPARPRLQRDPCRDLVRAPAQRHPGAQPPAARTASAACRTRSASTPSASAADATAGRLRGLRARASSGRAACATRAASRPMRRASPDDEGSLYTFDPAASLTVEVDLAAGRRRPSSFMRPGHARRRGGRGAGASRGLIGVAAARGQRSARSLGRQRALRSESGRLPPDDLAVPLRAPTARCI